MNPKIAVVGVGLILAVLAGPAGILLVRGRGAHTVSATASGLTQAGCTQAEGKRASQVIITALMRVDAAQTKHDADLLIVDAHGYANQATLNTDLDQLVTAHDDFVKLTLPICAMTARQAVLTYWHDYVLLYMDRQMSAAQRQQKIVAFQQLVLNLTPLVATSR